MTTTREPRVGDRVRVTASREQLRSIHVPERLAGSCGWVEINDEDAEVDGHSVTWLVRFSSGDYEWWLRRSDFTLLDEEPAEPAPEPAQPVRTKAETLDLMRDILRAIAEYEDLGRPWVTSDGNEHTVTASEIELVTAGYRALYEKLKESL